MPEVCQRPRRFSLTASSRTNITMVMSPTNANPKPGLAAALDQGQHPTIIFKL